MNAKNEKWLYVAGGFSIVGLAAFSGSKWGAWLVVLIVLSMILSRNILKERFLN